MELRLETSIEPRGPAGHHGACLRGAMFSPDPPWRTSVIRFSITAMDQAIRNKLQRATQDARRLLEREFAEQLEGTFDILPDGTLLPEPGGHLDEYQRLVRAELVDAVQHRIAGGKQPAEAVEDYTREAAFTCLNRFVALKMLEARGLVQQCVSKGDESAGFKEFTGLAPGLADLPDKGYRLYLESLLDELSIEVKVLFDRRDAASLLWPRQAALGGLLAIWNADELSGVWGEDETIGWVYQYFNSQEERRQMRDESQAPRNSRELAVRNQFFTPRYVVQFLTDNTLGRIWYEMRKGNTRLVEQCEYLVRRPTEIFLDEGVSGPSSAVSCGDSNATAHEPLTTDNGPLTLTQPVYLPHRPQKDPRDLKILDPACGSGHFLLYCFDLLLTIYEEAWHDESLPSPACGGGAEGDALLPLREAYRTLDAFRAAVPTLILRHNLHGIDIDRRCVQIAALALWMRAQRAWQDAGIAAASRPRVATIRVVCAEPMPGEESLLQEFLDNQLSATPEDRVLGQLVRRVFKAMTLAGEAGSLLKIEEEIAAAVAEAKKAALAVPRLEQRQLFDARPTPPKQKQLGFETFEVTDEAFWAQAEQRVYTALQHYAEQAEREGGFQRRLFAHDAADGFAFIDVCRQRYDVALMNPPFSACSSAAKQEFEKRYPRTKNDVYAAFVERGLTLLGQRGMLGAITSRTGFFLSSFQRWREEILLQEAKPTVFADLGYGVLDTAMVETAAYCLAPRGVCQCGLCRWVAASPIRGLLHSCRVTTAKHCSHSSPS